VTAELKLQTITSAPCQYKYIISDFKDKLPEAGKQCGDQAMQDQTEAVTKQ